jgi:predicted metal-dependent phosphoesterase TrpH
MILDIHVHTTHSNCSNLRIDDILSQAQSRGLDGVCITDHNTMAIGREITEGRQENGLCLLIGMEYDTEDGDFLLFGPFEDLQPGMEADALLEIVAERQGVAVGAHPFREGRKLKESILKTGGCRIIETINGRNSEGENERVKRLTERYPLFQCGGSDAHHLEELGRTATAFTQVISNRQELIAALKKGDYHPVNHDTVKKQP